MKSITFHKEWLDLIEAKPLEVQTEVFQSVLKYAFGGVETNVSKEAREIFLMIKPNIKKRQSREVAQGNAQERKKAFGQSLVPFCGTYSKEMIRSFYDYWSELDKSRTKMRFEKQNTWELSRRLKTWSRNETNRRINTNSFAATKAQGEAVNSTAKDANWVNTLSIG